MADSEFKAPEQLRNYQAELFEIIKRQNSILFLPTGSGKTCIAIWLIKHLAADLKKPYYEGGKRTIFLVNTTELAYQQAAYVTEAGNFKVRVVCAKEGVDNWLREQWEDLEQFEVIVMTSQCYLNGLTHGYMKLQNANLLIFDECHHATRGHPMREIMQKFDILPRGDNGPRVLGLSATILNSNKKTSQVENELAELERTFRSRIVTSTFTQDIKKFATKPNEVIKDFVKHKLPATLIEFLKVQKEESDRLAKCFKLKDDDIVEMLLNTRGNFDILINVPGVNRTKLLTNAIKDIDVHCHEFGIFFGFMACNLYIIQMYRFMFELEKTQYVDLVLYFINVAQVIRKTLHNEIMKINGKFSLDAMMKASTEKLKYLFDVLRTLTSSDKCIVFVERKITAKALYFIIKWFSRLEKISNIRVDFITGTDCNPLRNTRESLYEKKIKEKLLKNFRGDLLNVLVATNIVEEGIDIPNCGLVIMFDEIKTYRSYVQSKGRARMQTSKYIVLNDIPRDRFLARLRDYRETEALLNQFIREKDINNWDNEDSPERSGSGRFYTTSQNASIKEENCVSLIHRYCASLPSDIFTSLVPFWWSSEAGDDKICKLQLPINSPICDLLVGPPRPNLKKAKQAVAFEAVKLLHQLGGLNDQLLPVTKTAELEDIKEWIPNWEEAPTQDSDEAAVGQEQVCSKLKLPTFLEDSRPVANELSYIHFLDIVPEYEVPEVLRKVFCHKLLECNDYNFGILTRKPLPNLCRFPVYSDLGRCQVTIQTNCELVVLDDNQISNVSRFHRFLFLNVIRKVKKFLRFDAQSSSGYFVVPLTKNEEGVGIAWKVVRKKIETVIRRPSELDRETEEFTEGSYLGKVVTPWYRQVEDPTFYIVTNFASEVYLHSRLDNKRITYAEHFEKTYNLRALQPGQPMMEVRAITKNFDCIKPRPVSSSAKQKKKTDEDRPTYLPPEFVCKQSLNSIYWYKSILLPSILHRFQQLLLAEDLRQTLVEKTGVGRFDITIDKEKENEYFLRTTKAPITIQHISKIRNLRIKERKALAESEKIPDLVRDINHCDDFFDITVDDVKKYVEYVEQPLENLGRARAACSDSQDYSCDGNTRVNGEYVISYVPAPSLTTLRENVDSSGPNHYEILQALTLRGANDVMDLERYETLGDSLLKYLVSFAIFIREGTMNEGLLTSLKGRIIGNKYLLDCAKKHGIPDYIQAATFIVDRAWIPPSFCVPPYLGDIIPELGKYSSLLKVTIPYHEQFSGNLSPESIDNIAGELKEFFQNVEDIDKTEEGIGLFFLGRRKLYPKPIADVVEALIGVYLQTCGIEGAFNVMKHFGILQKEDYTTLMSYKIPSPVLPELSHQVLNMIPDYRKLEQLLNYEFRDKALLLQALTHPSCLTNHLTDCYQKLEFVGDAVLDFLITSYIYEYCGQLSPGEITDLRAALVNNNTFGALAVRLGLQKYLLEHCKNLESAIQSFVSYQKSKNYEIHGNEMMTLVSEGDTTIAEEVDVPKALGDVFESLAGAIFLDCQFKLSVVWNIYFNIMAEEIAKFCSKIPKNPVKVVFERFVNKVKFNSDVKRNAEAETKGDKLIVRLCVNLKRESHTFVGRGLNSVSAKRAAAKLALKHLGYSDFVI